MEMWTKRGHYMWKQRWHSVEEQFPNYFLEKTHVVVVEVVERLVEDEILDYWDSME